MKNTILFTFLFTAFCGQILTAQTGSVGIGTTTPTGAKLVVHSASGIDALLLNNPIRSASPGVGLYLQDNSNSDSGGGSIQIGGSTGIQLDRDDIDRFGQPLFINFNSSSDVRIAGGGGNIIMASGGDVTMASGGGIVKIGTNPTSFGNDGLQVGYTNSAQRAASFINNSPSSGGGSFPTLMLENQGITGHALIVLEGTVQKPGGGSWGAPSDRRLKQNITNYSKGLEQIKKIRPVTFQYNEKSGFSSTITYVGTIAQEVEEVAPDMVTHDGEYLGVDPSAFTYMLINAVQEQDQIITDQQKEIDELKARLDRIEALLNK